MFAEVISVPTGGTPLDGLFYQPPRVAARQAAMLMHGNGMNFYSGAPRFLPRHLLARGIASLAFNRHGHDTVSSSTRSAEGNAFQTVAEAIDDNEHAARYLAERGYPAPIVVGHSNGGLLAAWHAVHHPGTPALVLLSAHCGGPQMLQRASSQGLLAGDRLAEISARAHQLVEAGDGGQLIVLPGWFYVTTAASFVDMETNTPVLLDAAPAITCPVLFLRGDEEDPSLYPAEAFAEAASGPVDVRIIKDCNHFYQRHEAEVGEIIGEWLAALERRRPPRANAWEAWPAL